MAKIVINQAEQVLKIAKENTLMRCVDCMHYKGTRHPSFDEPCAERGVQSTAIAPMCFTPNISIFRKHHSTLLPYIAALLRSFTPNEARVFSAMLARSATLKGAHRFMDKRYFAAGGNGAYLTDYCHGYIVSKGMEADYYLLVGDKVFNGAAAVTAHIHTDSLMTAAEFKTRKSKLLTSGRLIRPTLKKKVVIDETYEPPSIDSSDTELDAKAQGGKRAKSRTLLSITTNEKEPADA